MANRFNQLLGQQYQSIAVPLPFDAIKSLGEVTEKRYNDAKTDINTTGALIDAAIKSSPKAQDLKNELITEYRNKLNDSSQKILENPSDSKTITSKLISDLQRDTRFQDLNTDFENYKNIYEPNLKNPLYDPTTDNNRDIKDNTYIKYNTWEDVKNNNNWKSPILKNDFNTHIDKLGAYLQPELADIYSEGTELQKDAQGNQFVKTKTGQTKYLNSQIQRVKNAARKEAEAFLNSPESEYFKAHYSNNLGINPDLDFTTQYFLDKWEKNFYNQSNTTEGLKLIKKGDNQGSETSDNNGSGKSSNGTDNVLKKTLETIKEHGESISSPAQVAAINNGKNNENGSVEINMSGRNIYTHIGGTGKENLEFNQKAETYNNYKDFLLSDGQFLTEHLSKIKAPSFDNFAKKNNLYNYYITREGNGSINITGTYQVRRDITGNPLKEKDFYNEQRTINVKPTSEMMKDILNVAKTYNNPELNKLREQAILNGVDITDAFFGTKEQEKYNKTEKARNLNQKLKDGSLNGIRTFNPYTSQANILKDNQGKLYSSGETVLFEDDLNNTYPDGWKDLLTDGIIKKGPVKEGVQTYLLPSTFESTIDSNNATRNSQIAVYNNTQYEAKIMDEMINENTNIINSEQVTNQKNNIKKHLETKTEDSYLFLNNIEKTIETLENSDRKKDLKIFLEDIKNNKNNKEKAEDISDLWINLYHPEVAMGK